MSVGICRYSGGGMMQCPEAVFDDGIFDLTLIDKISKIKVLMNIPRLYSGSFVHNKEVHQFKGNYIEIEAGKELLLEVDGEVVGAGNALLTLLPKELKVLKL
jgi:diacylglycerol kinase family enzyme